MRRFTRRDLYWFALVVAMGVAWWVDRAMQSAQHDTIQGQMRFDLEERWRKEMRELSRPPPTGTPVP